MPDSQHVSTTPAASDASQPQRGADGTVTDTATDSQQAASTPASGQDDAAQQDQQQDIHDPEKKRLSDEAAKWRKQAREQEKRLKELEAAEQARKDADLSAQERAEKKASDAEKRLADIERTTRERVVRAEVRVQATTVGIKPELAMRLLDLSEVEYDDEGEPQNIDKLLKALAKAYPELVSSSTPGASQQSGTPPSTSTTPTTPNPGATNPARQNGPLTVTLNQAYNKDFQTQFQQQYGMSVTDAVLKGKAQLV